MGNPALDALAEELWQHYVRRSPYLQMRVGVPVESLPAGTIEEAQEEVDFATHMLQRVRKISTEGLDDSDRVTHALIVDQTTALTEAVDDWWTTFPVTPYVNYFTSIALQQVLPAIPVDTEADRYLSVAESLATLVTTITSRTEQLAAHGWVVPAPALGGAVATFAGLKAAAAASLGSALEKAPNGAAASITKVRDELLLPAFDGVLALLESSAYKDKAPSGVGLSQFPGGEQAYRRLVRRHATFDIEPDQIQKAGYEQMAELAAAKAEIRQSLGFADEASFIAHLKETGRLHATTPEDIEAAYNRHIARIEPVIGDWFSILPEAPYGVKRLDEALEAGMSYGYYEPPTEGQPIGRYRYNGSGLESRSQINTAPLIYHELVPGHHFHIARQAETKDVPTFRREALAYAAFTEGWAEYAAMLAGEMGMYADPIDAYGHLVHQSFLTCRLVVDPGMNALGMSLEEARDYMRANCLESETQIATETLRYSTDIPAQAIGYRLGHKYFERLREQARAALGDRFDIKAFHEVTLGQGARPMSVVEDDVNRWVAATSAA